MRERLLRLLIERLQADPASVVDTAADEEALQLRDLVSGSRDVEAMFVLGAFYTERHQRTGNTSDRLDATYFLFSVYSRGESALPRKVRKQFAALRRATRGELADWSGRAVALADSSARSGDIAEIEQAVALFRRIAAATAGGYPTHALDLTNLCGALIDQYRRNGNLEGLREAVAVGREALRIERSRFDTNRMLTMANFASAAIKLCAAEMDEPLLGRAVAMVREAAGLTGRGHLYRLRALTALSGGLEQLYLLHGNEENIREAVAVAGTAVEETPKTEVSYPMACANLSGLLFRLYQLTGDTALLAEAAGADRAAVTATPLSHPSRPDRVASLLFTERSRYEATEPALLLGLLDSERRDATTPERMSALAYGLMLSHLHVRNADAVDEAVTLAERALRGVPADDLGRPAYALNTPATLRDCTERDGGRETATA